MANLGERFEAHEVEELMRVPEADVEGQINYEGTCAHTANALSTHYLPFTKSSLTLFVIKLFVTAIQLVFATKRYIMRVRLLSHVRAATVSLASLILCRLQTDLIRFAKENM